MYEYAHRHVDTFSCPTITARWLADWPRRTASSSDVIQFIARCGRLCRSLGMCLYNTRMRVRCLLDRERRRRRPGKREGGNGSSHRIKSSVSLTNLHTWFSFSRNSIPKVCSHPEENTKTRRKKKAESPETRLASPSRNQLSTLLPHANQSSLF